MFDGASNVQKAGAIISQHYPCAVVEHGAEHVVSLIVEKLMVMPCLCEYGKLCKVASYTILIGRSAILIIILLII